jgi:glycosyltransferase involved in cell wall biosynthesis
MTKNLIICLNLDTIKNKNIYQFDSLKSYGYTYICCGYLENMGGNQSNNYSYLRYPRSITKRILFIFNLLSINSKRTAHIELYTGNGNFVFLEFLLLKLFNYKSCVVERGTPLINIKTPGLKSFLRKIIYKKSDQVWIRELWMKKVLSDIKVKEYFFLSNAIQPSKITSHTMHEKKYSFIWCNSFKKWRNLKWFISTLNLKEFTDVHSMILGYLENNHETSDDTNYAFSNKPKNCEILKFQDPKMFFVNAQFFVLPADIVYLNFSLLEAMSHGVVPIISDVQGARDIVQDGIDGIIANHSQSGLEEAMNKAKQMTGQEYNIMSINARNKILKEFSIETWSFRLSEFYKTI